MINEITTKAMGKPTFIILSSVLVVGGLLGVIFEVYKMSQDSILGFVKRDIVGDYDALYDEYFPRYYHATGILSLPFDGIVEPFEAWVESIIITYVWTFL